MKTNSSTRYLAAACCMVSLSVPSFAQSPAKVLPRRNAATHEEIASSRLQASQNDPHRNLKPLEGPDPSTVNPPKDLVSQSDLICFNGMATLVPKRAVIYIPPGFKNRMAAQPGALLFNWSEFYAANRGWITTVEISRTQAEGNTPLSEDTLKQFGKSANLMVATYKGGPISLLPLKTPVETAVTK